MGAEDKIALGTVDAEGSSDIGNAKCSFPRNRGSTARFEEAVHHLYAFLANTETRTVRYQSYREAFALARALIDGPPVNFTKDDEIRAQLCGIMSEICSMCSL